MIEADEFKGIFEFRPLEPGFGVTIGNTLRRILLSSLEGYAITSLRIDGVVQEFATIRGVVEDVSQIILNLKKIRFKKQIDTENSEKIHIVIGDQEVFKAGDINKFLSVFQVLNPDEVVCHMDSSVKLSMELTIDKGRGYVPAEENKSINATVDTIAIDSIHTPIKNVKYHIENWNSLHIRQLLKTKLVDMDLSVRALNCLKAADVESLGDLVTFNKNDLLKFRNFGKKSLTELEELVKSKGLEFGMNISKYKLDKE